MPNLNFIIHMLCSVICSTLKYWSNTAVYNLSFKKRDWFFSKTKLKEPTKMLGYTVMFAIQFTQKWQYCHQFFSNLYEFLSSVEYKRRHLQELYCSFMSVQLQWMETGVSKKQHYSFMVHWLHMHHMWSLLKSYDNCMRNRLKFY